MQTAIIIWLALNALFFAALIYAGRNRNRYGECRESDIERGKDYLKEIGKGDGDAAD